MPTVTEYTLPEPVPVLGDADAVHRLVATPGALVTGHFELLGGLHSAHFFKFSTIARDSAALDTLAGWLVPQVQEFAPDALLAPTTAGVGLGWTLATALGTPLHLAAVGDDGRATGIIGAPDVAGTRILLVNDIVTTGRGLAAMTQIVADQGADAAGACWFLTRSEIDVKSVVGIPCARVVDWNLPAWSADACELCATGGEPVAAYDLN
jgi:orotate phosphoribosyltransferase